MPIFPNHLTDLLDARQLQFQSFGLRWPNRQQTPQQVGGSCDGLVEQSELDL